MAATHAQRNSRRLREAIDRSQPASQTWPVKFSPTHVTTASRLAVSISHKRPQGRRLQAQPFPQGEEFCRSLWAQLLTYRQAPLLGQERINELLHQRPGYEARSRRETLAPLREHVCWRRLHRHLFAQRDVLVDEGIERAALAGLQR